MKNVFLDDIRTPLDPENWIIIRNFSDFIALISNCDPTDLPKVISFDHDLGFEHYEQHMSNPTGYIPYDAFKEKTGYHALNALITFCLESNIPMPECRIHTQNSVGRDNMQRAINNYYEVLERWKK